jgi:5-methylcytosine-specific restriction endonuclease McrA
VPTGVYDRKLAKERKFNSRLDITGQRFGRLVAIAPATRYKKNGGSTYYWKFRCDCGVEKEILLGSVTRKKDPTRSCGCLLRKRTEHLGSAEKVNFLRSGLRNLWLRWPPRYYAKAAAKVARGVYQCEGYDHPAHNVKAGVVHVDHIEPIGDLESWDSYIEKLFCPASNLQVLCKDCHDKKTTNERAAASDRRRKDKLEQV